MSDVEIQRNLTRLRGITAFWDDADRAEVRRMISRAAASRVSATNP